MDVLFFIGGLTLGMLMGIPTMILLEWKVKSIVNETKEEDDE